MLLSAFCNYANSISRTDSREIEYYLTPHYESVDHAEDWRRFHQQPKLRPDFADVARYLQAAVEGMMTGEFSTEETPKFAPERLDATP